MPEAEIEIRDRVSSARKSFSAMVMTYFLGVFNDNFYRQTLLLMAVTMGKEYYQSYVTVIFPLPFILCAAYAGWFSDRFPKYTIMISSKILEFTAMAGAAAGLIFKSWWLLFTTLAIMAFQSAMFSPALSGTLPEMYPKKYVVRANAIIRIVSNTAILIGVALAGLALDRTEYLYRMPLNLVIFIAVVLTFSFVGILLSLFVPKFPAANPKAKFPKKGPLDTLILLMKLGKDPVLGIIILSNAFLWFMGSMVLLLINQLSVNQLDFEAFTTSVVIVSIIAGIAAGALLSSRLVYKMKWQHLLIITGILMGVVLSVIGLVVYVPNEFQFAYLAGMFFLLGTGSGAFTIPVKAFIQILPKPEEKGTVIAASNFAVFIGVLLSGPFLFVFNYMNMPANQIFFVISALVFIVAAYLLRKLPMENGYV